MAEEHDCASIHVLENAVLRVVITNYGGRIMSLLAPDRSGQRADVVLGFDEVASYAVAGGSFGALLGRCANRIAQGCFTIDGHSYELSKNNDGATLHGGTVGFSKVFWDVENTNSDELKLRHISPDGDQGFPGELSVIAHYTLVENALRLELSATTTKPTPVSLSGHSYFNLAGHGDILSHQIKIAADHYLPTDAKQIPTGELRPVSDTPFDFRQPLCIGAHIREVDQQLMLARGYDHCFVLQNDPEMPAARAFDPASGRVLELFTSQPGLQFYTGNNLNGSVAGRRGAFRQSDGFALEAQGFPNAINEPGFPSPILRPGETYRQSIIYRFAVDN